LGGIKVIRSGLTLFEANVFVDVVVVMLVLADELRYGITNGPLCLKRPPYEALPLEVDFTDFVIDNPPVISSSNQ
jgi:hypothetical protein